MQSPEPVSSLIPRAVANAANGNAAHASRVGPRTLPDLVRHFERIEAEELPDVVMETKMLRMTPDGDIEVPQLHGHFALTDWSRGQLSSLLGVRWARWSEDAPADVVAEEVNRRLSRATGEVRVRSTEATFDGIAADGTIRAFVSPGYSTVADSRVARLLAELLDGEDVSVSRFDVTPMTTSYVLGVGKPLNPRAGSVVGDVRGSVLVQNSGTGWASLLVSLFLERLICSNGMRVSDSSSVRRTHRGIDDPRLKSLLANAVSNFGPRVHDAADRLLRSTDRLISGPVKDAIEHLVVRVGKLPRRILPDIYDAYVVEPHASAFGVAQALTLAAQHMTPELRVELESLAGRYLADVN